MDLTRIGGRNVTPDQWYIGLLGEIGRATGGRGEMVRFWKEGADVSPMQRFFGALAAHAPPEGAPPLVVFVDEVDAARSLPFSADEFFGGVRERHNRRAHDPAFGRLTLCLLGAALPSGLVRDMEASPFNVGERIPIKDFTPQEARAFAAGLGEAARPWSGASTTGRAATPSWPSPCAPASPRPPPPWGRAGWGPPTWTASSRPACSPPAPARAASASRTWAAASCSPRGPRTPTDTAPRSSPSTAAPAGASGSRATGPTPASRPSSSRATSPPKTVATSPDRSFVVACGPKGWVSAWEATHGEPLWHGDFGAEDMVALAVAPDGRTAVANREGEVVILDRSGRAERTLSTGERLVSLAFSKGGDLATGGHQADGSVKVWNVRTGALVRS